MGDSRVDLKQLIFLIKENKDFEANLILDEGCIFESIDPKPLVKIINYTINYLNQLSDTPLEISLDLRSSDYLLSLMAYTDKTEIPPISAELNDALKNYKGSLELVHDAGKLVQIKVSFKR